jgi:predicted acyl esterase
MTETFLPSEPRLLHVEISDGVRLAVHHYPAARAPAPATVMLTPYRKESSLIRLTRRATPPDFHFFVADVRGFGGSGGAAGPVWSDREIRDGVELIEWVADASECDGNVAMIGSSYCGANQLLIAARHPRGLRCITPWAGPTDQYRDMWHRGGIISNHGWGANTYVNSQRQATVRWGLEHFYTHVLPNELDTPQLRERSPASQLSEVEVPTLCLGGWFDYFLSSTIRTYGGIAAPKRLVIGPWSHGDAKSEQFDEQNAWLRYWLTGEGEDPTARERVRLFQTGRNEWVSLDDWPDPASLAWIAWHPQTSQGLGPSPAEKSIPLEVVPHVLAVPLAPNPKPGTLANMTGSGFSVWGEHAVFDGDVLDRTVLAGGPCCFLGRLRVRGCDDLDLYVRLSVVKADGTCEQLSEGRLRASHRALDPTRTIFATNGDPVLPWHSHTSIDRVEPDVAVDLAVELSPIWHQFNRGDRPRLGLTLVRADEDDQPAMAFLEPDTKLLVPSRLTFLQ